MPSSERDVLARAEDEPDGPPPDPGTGASRRSQSLEKGLAILACFTAEHPVLGVAEVADETGLTRSSSHRYMTTLVALGYLGQSTSRKYRVGLRGHDIGLAAVNALGLREHARGPMEQLRRETRCTTSLALLDGVEVLYVERVRSHRKGQCLVDMDLWVGSRQPAHCTALGKLLLAHLPYEKQRDLTREIGLTRRAPNSITSERAFKAELADIKERGVAISDRELLPEHAPSPGPCAQAAARSSRRWISRCTSSW
jgi:IclR family transcriptional regulator, pca regulon regulatory protein